MPKTKVTSLVQTRLSKDDFNRLRSTANQQLLTQAQLARDAIRWYLDHYDLLKHEEHESAYAAQLKSTTNRIAGLLYRIGVSVQSLYEFQWAILSNDGKDVFESCVNKAKEKLRTKFVQDERAIVSTMAKTLEQ